ncbi:ATP-binding protein [Xylophilus ampelinus]|nr:ATP-binding protein [Xylophilus ampelinus]MCS4509596.1 response regulator [Xylophilus ampelinus]
MERRVMVHAPRGRDANVVHEVLAGRGIPAQVCQSQDEMLAGLAQGAAAAVVTEEAFGVTPGGTLDNWLRRQPSWSDFPFIVLTTRQPTRRSVRAAASLHALGNVVLLERPVNAETLASAVEAAVRARNRQYATRRNLEDLGEARATVERLNGELEGRIAARTRELAGTNDRLMAEISERERAQAALVQVQKMEAIGRLTGGIAHDFNNLLHVVSMNLDLLARLAPEPRVAKVAAQAKRAVGRGSRLTGQLLSFARAQSLLPRLTDINALMLGMQELVSVSVGAGVELRWELSEEPLWAKLDPSQLEMAVLNLAVNAKDAMDSGGRLTLSTRRAEARPDPALSPGTYVVVSVADDGPGIPAALLQKVFDPFFTTKPVGSGTGLGLSQVYGFAQQSDGLARIESESGRGTVVEMCFPLLDDRQEAALPEAASAPPQPGLSHRILVVEDDADVRRVIVESLQLAGHIVTDAADGHAGLAALAIHPPELLIVDYAMPLMNGAQVIQHALREIPGLPVILATGYADMVEVGRVLGTQSILVEPFDISTLLDAVAQAMRS